MRWLLAWWRFGLPMQPIMEGYQPRDNGRPQAPPPRGGSSAMRPSVILQTALNNPMPSGIKESRRPCPHCGR